ncbi:MAG: 2-C-methyl-D-erythritol 4-phosphate cytidylyltransferase [Clostridiales bacterium]|nr:2-C-methyl-D-erythritol 4-phosphate cytidylyltransferase [Clostridiales bacterium]
MITAIICAAGKGERAGFNKNKVLAPLFGEPVLYLTLKKFNIEYIDEIIVTCSPQDMTEISAICKPFNAKVVLGGATRTESVFCALKEALGDIVLIHDGARPFVSEKIILDCIKSVKAHGSGICCTPLTDTAIISNSGKTVDKAVDRSTLFAVQTPQGFLTKDIIRAHTMAQLSGLTFTDDSAIYSKYIAPARLFEGESANKKLTFKNDFYTLPPLNISGDIKIGYGVDTHAFGSENNFVTLCGEKIECDNGLIAHSDGDVAVHAVMDAILSGAGLKDIGHYFPDTDEKFKGASSLKMLEKVVELALDKGYCVGNLSLTIQAEKPRLAKHIDKMVKNLATVLQIEDKNITVSAGTCEGLGFVGEGLGICATAVACLKTATV